MSVLRGGRTFRVAGVAGRAGRGIRVACVGNRSPCARFAWQAWEIVARGVSQGILLVKLLETRSTERNRRRPESVDLWTRGRGGNFAKRSGRARTVAFLDSRARVPVAVPVRV